MQYFSDEQLDAMFGLLDFEMLYQMGYDLDSDSPDELEDLLMSIEEDFSELDREDKIAELRQIGAFEDDYLISEVKMGAEGSDRRLRKVHKDDTRYKYPNPNPEPIWAEWDDDLSRRGREAFMKLSPEEKKEWTIKWRNSARPKGQRTRFTDLLAAEETCQDSHLDGIDFLPWSEDAEGSTCYITGLPNPDGDIEGEDNICEPCAAKWIYDYEGPEGEGYYRASAMSAETKRQRMKREKEEAAMDEASTDVDYMREHYSESDAYIYAYNDGHTDARGDAGYRPSATDRELTSFKKIFKQAETFAADSPFNTLLMIREDIIIDDEEDFDRLLSVYMSLETDIAQLYQETSNPKHPLLGEMMRYRNRIANRLDELQEEVAIQDTIEMDAEQRRLADPTVPIQLEKPLRTGYKLGIGAIAAGLTIPLAILGIGAFYNRE